jgi:tetratricopeptide (TPR) repeat protein
MIAERNFEQAVAAVDSLLTEVGEIDLADVPQMEQTRRDLLTKARSFYERFLDENETPEARRDAGRARSRLGDIHELLGEYAEANASYLAALEIQVPLAEANPDDEPIVADLARTRHSLAVLLKKMNEFSESESLLNQARAARAELVQDAPDHLEHKSELASSTYQLGTVLSRLVGRGEEARRLYDTSIEMQREVVEGRGGLEEDLRELGRYLNNLALLLQGTEPGAAGDAFEESIGLQRRLVEENSDVPHYGRELARTLNNQVRDEIASDPDAAEPSLREAIVLSRRLTQDFPTVPEYWSELGGYLNNLGLALAERGRLKDDQASAEEAEGHFQEAEEAFRRCESIRKDLAARYPLRPEFRHRLALIRHNLSKFLRGRDQAEEAGVPLGTAIESLRSLVAEYPDVPEYQKDLALALLEQSSSFFSPGKDASQALALAEEAQRHAEESLQDRLDDQVYLDALRTVHLHRAWFFGNLGNHQESVEHARFLGENAFGNPRWLYLAAELQAQARSRVVHDEALSPDERQSLQERYLEEAASWLNRAADAGFRRIDFAEAQFGAYAEREQIRRALERIRGTADESR